MKKFTVLVLLLMFSAVIVTGCSKKTVGMDFSASDVERLEVHQLYADEVTQSSAYEKKVVTDSKDIENVVSSLQSLKVGKDVSKEKPAYAPAVLTFRFTLKDGTGYVLIYKRWAKGGGVIQTSSLFHNVTGDDALGDLWETLSYDIEPSSETEILFTE